MAPEITVLMSVYNGEKYLREAVESILNQTFSDFEFLIIDDASTDSSLEILQSYDDPRIKIIRNIENLGLTKSLNIGIRLAKREYIARMDADDISLPERFERQITFLLNHPDIALAGTFYQNIDHEGNIFGTCNLLLKPRYQDFIKGNCIIHGSVMVRSEVMVTISGYNELIKKCQDYALWLQLAKEYQLCNIPDVLYKLRIHENSVSIKGWEESKYYHILAVRMAEGTIPQALIDEIASSGIRCLRNYLTKSEWVFYCSSMAEYYRFYGDLKRARMVYWKIFLTEPWNILNLLNLVRVSFGNRVLDTTGQLYTYLINIYYLYRN